MFEISIEHYLGLFILVMIIVMHYALKLQDHFWAKEIIQSNLERELANKLANDRLADSLKNRNYTIDR